MNHRICKGLQDKQGRKIMIARVKEIPSTIGIFGASGHIGGPMASWLRFHAPQIRLRLITSDKRNLSRLRLSFPQCEICIGDFFDPASLTEAVAGMEGLFVLTRTFTSEDEAMTNLVAAIREAACLKHMIRLVGEIPAANLRRVPQELHDFGLGIELQHPIARRIIDNSGLPNTYFNIGASYMDNLLRLGVFLPGMRKILTVEHQLPWIDPREIGEAAARILLDQDLRHLYQFHTLNNGIDNLFFRDLAALMTDVLQIPIQFDGSEERFVAELRKGVEAGLFPAFLPEYLRHYHRYEDENQVAWTLNDFLERTLGRKPNSMRAWLNEHRSTFLEQIKVAGGLSPQKPLEHSPSSA